MLRDGRYEAALVPLQLAEQHAPDAAKANALQNLASIYV